MNENIYKLTFNPETKRWDYLKITSEYDDDKDDEIVEFFHLSSDEDAACIVKRRNQDLASGYCEVYTCKDCGGIFFIDVKEKDWYIKKKYQLPKRCRTCRVKKREKKS